MPWRVDRQPARAKERYKVAGYRQIHTKIWNDEWFAELEQDEKLFFIYLFSNEASNLTGLYKQTMRVMQFETGLKPERITKIFESFSASGKAFYQDGVVYVCNMARYNSTTSPKTRVRMDKELQAIADKHPLKIAYLRACNTVSIPYLYRVLKTETETETETETRLLPSLPADNIKTFSEVTGMVYVPSGDLADVMTAMDALRTQHQNLTDYLKPYYQEWTKRGYNKTNCAWLTGWAVAGEIPPKKPKPGSAAPVPDGYTRVGS